MALINGSVEPFSEMLQNIRNQLMSEVVSKLVEPEAELFSSHRESTKADADACIKKCKDEHLLNAIGKTLEDLPQSSALLKEKSRELPEVIAEKEAKSLLKENLMQRIEKLKNEQAKNRELIEAQNKANKVRLKELNKIKRVFEESLKLEIRKIRGEKLQFVFRNLDHGDPERPFTFFLMISNEGVYQIESCSPPLECISQLEERLRTTNNFSAFLANVRKEFKALVK